MDNGLFPTVFKTPFVQKIHHKSQVTGESSPDFRRQAVHMVDFKPYIVNPVQIFLGDTVPAQQFMEA